MFSVIYGKLLSILISGMMLAVSEPNYEKKMAGLPSLANANTGINLQGWTYESVTSEKTGITHYYYYLPSKDPSAPYMVMLHGFVTNGRAFLNLSELSEKYNLISYNFPEESPLYKGSMSNFNNILSDFFTTKNIKSMVLIGNSVGGAIALHYTATLGQKQVTDLILVSTSVFGSTSADRQKSNKMAQKLLKYPDYKLFFLVDKAKWVLSQFENTNSDGKSATDILMLKKPSWYRQVLASMATYDGTHDASDIQCPVLAIHGDKDQVISLASGKSIPTHIPQARFTVLSGKGHSMIYIDGEKLVTIIKDGLVKKSVDGALSRTKELL